jgi:hypothetical protein
MDTVAKNQSQKSCFTRFKELVHDIVCYFSSSCCIRVEISANKKEFKNNNVQSQNG